MSGANTGYGAADAGRFVLVVDSEPRSLLFTSMIIERLGYRACSALGVGSALEIAHASAPLAIVSELHLKGLGALDLLARLQGYSGGAAVPVVVATRELTAEAERRCREAGAAACIGKPLQATELYRTIHPLIEPGTRRRDLRVETRPAVTVDNTPLDLASGEGAVNLSVSGMRLRTRTPYAEDAKVLLRLAFHEEEVETEARVAYCRPLDDGSSGMWGVGLQFLNTPPRAGEIIRNFIHDTVTHGMDGAG